MIENYNYNKNTNNYLNTIYDERRPITKYPSQLCQYLYCKYKMKRKQKLLDIGCGRGDFLIEFKKLGLDVQGVDRDKHSSEILEKAGIKIKQIDISTEKSLSSAYNGEEFDIVFCKSTIEHFHDPGILLKEIYRVLKLNGTLIMMTPDWTSNMKIYYDDFTHKTPFTVTSIIDTLEMFGFKNVNAELFYQIPAIWKHSSLKILSWIIRQIVPITIATKLNNNEFEKFIRWSCELQILASGTKGD